MKSLNTEFLRRLLIFSAILGVIMVLVRFMIPRSYLSPTLPFLLMFFMATTMISFMVLSRTLSKKFIRFVNTFLLTILVKLVLFIAIMVGYILWNRPDAVPFMIAFFILYLVYMIFEVVWIIRITRIPKGSSAHE